MKKYIVNVTTRGSMFIVKGKQVRSPFTAEVTEQDICSLKTQAKFLGIEDYITISPFDSSNIQHIPTIKKQNIEPDLSNYVEDKEVKIEELTSVDKYIKDLES